MRRALSIFFAALLFLAQARTVAVSRDVRSVRWQLLSDHTLMASDEIVGAWQPMPLGGQGRGFGPRLTIVQLVTADCRLLIAFDELPPVRDRVEITVACIEFYGSKMAPADRQAVLVIDGNGGAEVAVSLYPVD